MTIARHGIAVVIAAYNAERYVAAAIESVLAQTLPPAEVVVVDDGSTDGTGAILDRFAGCVRILTQQNTGGAAATNRGLACTSAGLLCFQDADDLWLPEKLELQSRYLEQHPQTEAVFGHVQQFISDDLTLQETMRLARPGPPQPGISKVGMMIRRAAFDRVGPFDGAMRAIEFVEWYTRAVDADLSSHVLPDLVARRRLHASNNGLRVRGEQMGENLLALRRKLDRHRARQDKTGR